MREHQVSISRRQFVHTAAVASSAALVSSVPTSAQADGPPFVPGLQGVEAAAAATAEHCRRRQLDLLQRAGQLMGVTVSNQVAALSRGASAIWMAPLAGIENIAPLEYSLGVDLAINYFRGLPDQPVPDGFYLIRTDVIVDHIGFIDGAVQLVRPGEGTLATRPALYRVFSLELPPPNGNGVEVAGNIGTPNVDDGTNEAPSDRCDLYIKCHENGCWDCYNMYEDVP